MKFSVAIFAAAALPFALAAPFSEVKARQLGGLTALIDSIETFLGGQGLTLASGLECPTATQGCNVLGATGAGGTVNFPGTCTAVVPDLVNVSRVHAYYKLA